MEKWDPEQRERDAGAGRVAAHYDALDAFYREVWGEHVHHGLWLGGGERLPEAQRQLVERVAKEAGVERGHAVCDIGSGYGAPARLMATQLGARVSAITVSPAQHAVAVAAGRDRAEGTPEPEWFLGDWIGGGSPFRDRSFEAAVAIESAGHLRVWELRRFFQEVHRVLRPGGQVAVCGWVAPPQSGALAERWLLGPVRRGGEIASIPKASEQDAAAADAGLGLVAEDDLTGAVAPTWAYLGTAFAKKVAAAPRTLRFLFGRHARNRRFISTAMRVHFGLNSRRLLYRLAVYRRPEA